METTVEEDAPFKDHDLTTGPIGKHLWSLAWPLMLSIFFLTLYNIVDTFWVSKLSPEAIAAVSISQITLFAMVALSMGITVGSGVIMAMHIGAKEHSEAERVLGQSFVLAAIAALFFTVFALLFRNELLVLSGAQGAVFAPALEYFTVTALGSILAFIMMTVMFAFNAQGDTLSLTKLLALSTFTNIVLDPLLIFGWLGFPELGISGAAIATLISQLLFIIIAIRSLSGKDRRIRFYARNLTLKWESVKKVLNIGIPASLTQVIGPVGLAALMFVTSLSFFELGTIAFSIAFRIEFFAFLPAIGFGVGAMALISQNLGARKVDRAQEAFAKGILYSVGGAVAVGLMAILFAQHIVNIFTSDATVVGYVLSYVWIVALSYGFLAATMVEASAFQAIGRSWPGFWISLLRLFGISIPLSYVLTQVYAFPIAAIWAAITLGNIIAAVVGYFWVARAMKRINLSEIPTHDATPVASIG